MAPVVLSRRGRSDAASGLWCRAGDCSWQRVAGARPASGPDVSHGRYRGRPRRRAGSCLQAPAAHCNPPPRNLRLQSPVRRLARLLLAPAHPGRACKSCRSRNGASSNTSGGAGGCARAGGALQCRRLYRCLPFVYSLRLHLPADRRAPAALHEIDTADELRRFRVRDAWNRRAKAGVLLERLSSRGPSNAVSRLPYHPHGFGQHRAARNPLAHHAGPATQAGRAGVRHAAAPEGRGSESEFSPVYPRKVEPVQPAPTQNNVQYNVGPAATGNTAAKAETVQKPVAETTGVATRSDNSSKIKSAAPPDAQNAQAYAAQPKKNAPDEAAASNNRCDVQACASAYKSFRASDCTYQPLDGPIGACAARHPNNVPTASKETSRNVDPGAGARIRAKLDRRTRWRVYDEDGDDTDDAFLFRRSRRW